MKYYRNENYDFRLQLGFKMLYPYEHNYDKAGYRGTGYRYNHEIETEEAQLQNQYEQKLRTMER